MPLLGCDTPLSHGKGSISTADGGAPQDANMVIDSNVPRTPDGGVFGLDASWDAGMSVDSGGIADDAGGATRDAATRDAATHDAATRDAASSCSPRTETCNGLDDDCDGVVDNGTTHTYFADADGDSAGASGSTTEACLAPAGYVEIAGDCDDSDPDRGPFAFEACDGLDTNCDGRVDEGCACRNGDTASCGTTSTGECQFGIQECRAGRWGDCIGAVAPVEDRCNSLDDDCDGSTDEGLARDYFVDIDGDGYGADSTRVSTCAPPTTLRHVLRGGDCDNFNDAVHPGASEICNFVDENCNGAVDEGLTTSTWYLDEDHDGYGVAAAPVRACRAPFDYAAASGDCRDDRSSRNPGASETCNGHDDDCDGLIDDGVVCGFPDARPLAWCNEVQCTISRVGQPSARKNHTAIRDTYPGSGNRVVIWGGYESAPTWPFMAPTNTGGIYDLSTDSWATVSTVNAPSPRAGHSAVWDGERMLIWGGWGASGELLADGGWYSPATDSWERLEDSLTGGAARAGHTAAWTPQGLVVWGGSKDADAPEGEHWDGTSPRWGRLYTGDAPAIEVSALGTWTGTSLFVWGSRPSTTGYCDATTVAFRWSDVWEPTSRYAGADIAVWTGNKVLLWGGRWPTISTSVAPAATAYDPARREWSLQGELGSPPARTFPAAVWVDNRMFLWGGASDGSGRLLDDGYIWSALD